jgi:hypothetical protein
MSQLLKLIHLRIGRQVVGAGLAAGSLLGLVPSVVAAQDRALTEPSKVPLGVQRAEHLLYTAYPELRQRPLAVTYTPVDGQWAIRVTDAPTEAAAAPSVALVEAVVAFDEAGRLRHFRATGALLEDARNGALWQQMKEHPDWGESDADVWLQQVGGQSTVGRSAASVATLKPDEWQSLLGSVPSVAAARFRWRSEGASRRATPVLGQPPVNPDRLPEAMRRNPPPPPTMAIRPSWLVEVTAQDDGGRVVQYQLEYEPFGGKLIGAVRQ